MKLLLNLNVVLDVIQQRPSCYHSSAAIISRLLKGDHVGLLPSHALTTIHYLIAKYQSEQVAEQALDWLLKHFDVIAIDKAILLEARRLGFHDFGSAVVASAAVSAGCDCIITRNVSDFQRSPVASIAPRIFLENYL